MDKDSVMLNQMVWWDDLFSYLEDYWKFGSPMAKGWEKLFSINGLAGKDSFPHILWLYYLKPCMVAS